MVDGVELDSYRGDIINDSSNDPAKRVPDPARMYFTNVFVSRVDWWSSAPVQQYLNDIDSSTGIYLRGVGC